MSSSPLLTKKPSSGPMPTLDPSSLPSYMAISDQVLSARPSASVQRTYSHRSHKLRYAIQEPAEKILGIIASFVFLLLWAIVAAILVSFGTILLVGLPLAFGASYGAIGMLIGNGILVAAHFPCHANNARAAAIGAVGMIPGALLVGALLLFGRGLSIYIWPTHHALDEENNRLPWYITIISTIFVHALSGAIGVMIIFRHNRLDIGDIDILRATYAGAFGGVILGLGALVIAPYLVCATLWILLTPLWIAMKMGLRWMKLRSRERRNGISYRGTYFTTYGTCGDVPEIEEELGYDSGISRSGFDVGLFCGYRASVGFNNQSR